MKWKMWVIVTTLAIGSAAWGATNDLSGLLQKGLFEEEANRNLDAAVQAYQSLVTAFDRDRKLAATAVFRLGECYRKLGKTNEAVLQYERIVREFADEATLATLSRQNLAGMGAKTKATVSPALTQAARQEQKRLLEEEIKLLEQDLAEAQKRAEMGAGPQADVRSKEREILQLRRQLAGLDAGVEPANANKASAAPVTAAPDDEETEIRRLQAMIKDSPDLINAPARGLDSLTPLDRAASKGQLRVAVFLLDHGADINLKSPLRSATAYGHKAMVELLLGRGVDVNATDAGGQTALHLAAENGFLSVTEALLTAKADPNVRDISFQTPLALAAKKGFLSVAAALLARGADPNVASKVQPGFGTNPVSEGRAMFGAPLHLAAARGDIALTALLVTNRADVKVRSIYNETPLEVAAVLGKAKVAELLLAAGADPNASASAEASTPLSLASGAGHREVVKLLLEHGANPNAATLVGTRDVTPLMQAASAGADEIVTLLLEHKADPNLKDGNGQTALLRAMQQNKTTVVRTLLAHGADPNMRTAKGYPPMILASADKRNKDMTAALLEAKADPDAASPERKTALHYAVETGDRQTVALLLASRASVNARTESGSTPLHLAVGAKALEIAEMLLIAKADPNARDGQSQTPLDIAKKNPALADIAALLRQHGAQDWMPQPDRITVARRSTGVAGPVFVMGTNAPNRFTLLEVIAALPWGATGEVPSGVAPAAVVPFPDFSKVTITRRDPKTAKLTEIPVDVAALVASGDCSKDFLMEWGDLMNIPDREHKLNEQWRGLPTDFGKSLAKCLQRKVTVEVKGEPQTIILGPIVLTADREQALVSGSPVASIALPFWLKGVLTGNARLFSTSDLTRVKVRRVDPTTGRTHEWVFNEQTVDTTNDLWLRDGDVIEVPDLSPSVAGSNVLAGRVYISGQIRNQGGIDFLPNETLTVAKAIIRAGGFSDKADKRKVKVVRPAEGGSSKKEFQLDMVEILEQGKTENDIVLQPGDWVLVPSRIINY